MGILNRIYNIAKSEVNARFRRDKTKRKEIPEFDDLFTNTGSQGKAGSSAGSQSRNSDRDPKLEEWYAVLEIPYGSDFAAVQKAWKSQLRKYHPDRHVSDPERAKIAHEVTQQLNQAFAGLEKHFKKA